MKSPEISKVHLLLVRLALLFRKHTFFFGNMSLVMSVRAQYLSQMRNNTCRQVYFPLSATSRVSVEILTSGSSHKV